MSCCGSRSFPGKPIRVNSRKKCKFKMAKKAKNKVVVVEKSEKSREPNDEMRGRIVTVGFPLWLQSNRKRHLQFKAGKMYVIDNMVHPDPRKGYICIDQDDNHVMHFCWMERDALGTKEDDLTPEPYDSIFKKIHKCTTGRVYLLKIRSTNKNHFFWMQESSVEKDSEICSKVNYLLNFPPVWLRFPQIAWNCEMARANQSSEYNSAESDTNEPEGPQDFEVGAMANNRAVANRLQDRLSSLLQEFRSKMASRPLTSKDPFPQPVVGNISLMSLEDLLPVLQGGVRNQSENSVGSNVMDRMKALTAVGNGVVMGFIDGDVSDLESESDYLDVVDATDLNCKDSELTLQEQPSNRAPGPLRLRGPPEHKLHSPAGAESQCMTSKTAVKSGNRPADLQIKVLATPNVNYRKESSELLVSTTELNQHHQESRNDALEEWESITESNSVPQFETRASNVTWKDPLGRVKSEEDEFDPVVDGWQTARSSTVDASFIGSEVSSREFILSDIFAGSGGSTWKSATDAIEAVEPTTAGDDRNLMILKESKVVPSVELAEYDGASNGGAANVMALRVELGSEAKLEDNLEECHGTLIKDTKNKVELEQIMKTSFKLPDGVEGESQGLSDESGTKELPGLPRTGDAGKEVNSLASVDNNCSSEQSVPSTSKQFPERSVQLGTVMTLKPNEAESRSDETVSSVAISSSSNCEVQDGICEVEGTGQVSRHEIVQENLDRELAQDGCPREESNVDNIAMMVLASSDGSKSNSGVGNQEVSATIDEDRQRLDGATNNTEEPDDNGKNQTTAPVPCPISGLGTYDERNRPNERQFQNEEDSDTQIVTMSVVCGVEEPGMKAVPAVSKSLEEVVFVSGPSKVPRYNLRKRPQAARPSQSGPLCFGCEEGKIVGSRKKPRTSSPGVPLPAPFRVQDVSPVRTRHPRLSSARLVSLPNQGVSGSDRCRKRANDEESLESELEEPPRKKARASDGNGSAGAQSSSSKQLTSAGGSKRTPSGLSGRHAKTDGQQTEPVKIREIKKSGTETKVRTRITPQVPPQPMNRTNQDRSQNTKPVIIEDKNGPNPKPSKDRKPDRKPKP